MFRETERLWRADGIWLQELPFLQKRTLVSCGIWGFNFKECEKRFTCTPFIIYYLIRTISASVCSSYLLQIINSRQDHNFKIHMGKLIRASLQLRASVDVKLRSTSRVFAPSIFYESTWRKIGTIPLCPGQDCSFQLIPVHTVFIDFYTDQRGCRQDVVLLTE